MRILITKYPWTAASVIRSAFSLTVLVTLFVSAFSDTGGRPAPETHDRQDQAVAVREGTTRAYPAREDGAAVQLPAAHSSGGIAVPDRHHPHE